MMGGDLPPEKLFDAVLEAAKTLDRDCEYIVYLPRSIIQKLNHTAGERITFVPAEDVISQEDAPLEAVRRKKHSSLVMGIHDLRDKRIDTFVSIGNTGALIATATLTLKCFPGITRPALLALLPTQKGSVAVVDIGGNVNCTAAQMVQFAHMGVAYCQTCMDIPKPLVGLLNIGQESLKGDSEVRAAYKILSEKSKEFDFIGNVEGTTVFEGAVDVLVTDGFTGNVFLKASEGISALICRQMKSRKVSDLRIEQKFDYAEHPGALLCGLNGVIVKSHGYSTPKALLSSIKAACHYASEGVGEKMRSLLIKN
jgi:glycerol-3-phosphate acyltransferase PlsX